MSALRPPRELRALIARELGCELECPPWGRGITEWLAQAEKSAAGGEIVAALVPARMDTGWWWEHVRHHEVRFLRGRVWFEGEKSGAPFPSAIVIFGRPECSRWWDWRAVAREYERPALWAVIAS
jgi:hypothetical protein